MNLPDPDKTAKALCTFVGVPFNFGAILFFSFYEPGSIFSVRIMFGTGILLLLTQLARWINLLENWNDGSSST